jgi:hypothetical protein
VVDQPAEAVILAQRMRDKLLSLRIPTLELLVSGLRLMVSCRSEAAIRRYERIITHVGYVIDNLHYFSDATDYDGPCWTIWAHLPRKGA